MSPESREEAVLDAVRRRRELVDEAVDEMVPLEEPRNLYEASRSLLVAGGKRLRPSMLLLVAEALMDVDSMVADYRSFPSKYGDPVDVMAAAVSIEVIHSFTLIHDDIMDDDDMRRGVPAVHRAYDEATAILAGDTLYSKAFEIMLQTEAPANDTLESIEVLASTCTHICEGQAMDVNFEHADDVLPEDYLEMVELKTAVLYGAAAAVPAIVLGAEEDVVDDLYQYGLCVGQAFQIQDDVLDLTVPSEKLGKQRGSDLVEGKRTLITLHAREHGVEVDSLLDAADPDDVTEAEIDEAVAVLRDAGSIEYARSAAEDLVEQGKTYLETLPDNEARGTLAMLADYLIERGY
ncbi:MAG: geranylfarnesyl diphosphate synthase [Halobacteriaceae archaeon]